MSEYIPMSVLEHLRNYDGALFQNEAVLSLYLDVKAFVWTTLSTLVRSSQDVQEDSREYLAWSDDLSVKLTDAFEGIRPDATADLETCMTFYSSIIDGKPRSVPSVSQLLRECFTRCIQSHVFQSKQVLDYNVIQLDFWFREVFRLAFHHCSHSVATVPVPVTPKTVRIQSPPVSPRAESPVVSPRAESPVVEEDEADVEVLHADNESVVSRAMTALTSLSSSIKKPRVRTVVLNEEDEDKYSRFSHK